MAEGQVPIVKESRSSVLRGHTPPILGADGTRLPNSIASLERMVLGETEQWVLLRGVDRDNPVLLFLSNATSGSETGLVRRYNAALEQRFVVVTWDQRGTGKSFKAGFPGTAMTVPQLTSDAMELVAALRQRFDKRKIFLVGHSWGAVLGTRMVQERPEWFHAYVGVCPMLSTVQHDQDAWQYALEGAKARQATRAIRRLRRYGPPPYRGMYMSWRYEYLAALAMRYMAEDLDVATLSRDEAAAIPEYTLLDRLRQTLGRRRWIRLVYPRLRALDLMTQGTRLDVPVYVVAGADVAGAEPAPQQAAPGQTGPDRALPDQSPQDQAPPDPETAPAPATPIDRYFAALIAPHKAIVRFERSSTAPCFEEPDRFNQWLVEAVLPHAAGELRVSTPRSSQRDRTGSEGGTPQVGKA